MERDATLLGTIIKEIVDHPDEVKIDRTVDEMGVLLLVHINKEDMGKVIGRMGNTAKSLRAIMRAVGMKNNARVNMKIAEPPGSNYVQRGSDIYAGDVRDTGAGGVSDQGSSAEGMAL